MPGSRRADARVAHTRRTPERVRVKRAKKRAERASAPAACGRERATVECSANASKESQKPNMIQDRHELEQRVSRTNIAIREAPAPSLVPPSRPSLGMRSLRPIAASLRPLGVTPSEDAAPQHPSRRHQVLGFALF